MDKKNIEQLKLKIHQQVDQLQDETILQMLQEATEAYTSPNTKDILDELTPEQILRLQQSIQQADNGETITNEEVMAKAKEWLSK